MSHCSGVICAEALGHYMRPGTEAVRDRKICWERGRRWSLTSFGLRQSGTSAMGKRLVKTQLARPNATVRRELDDRI
jgi:hypothetical protein